ncbi:hypothetical protein ASE59_11395 [Sphingomonas sp. Leaf10]|nr:hypothetical protein ASE59_11395 [Sphingomonas sp. Leaf10]
MVKCDPNELVTPLQQKAMKRIRRREEVDIRLREDMDKLLALQRPHDASAMTVRAPVFRYPS